LTGIALGGNARGTNEPSRTHSGGPGCIVTVCRDCCCGSASKHPTLDHDRQLDRLRQALPGSHRVRTSTCLDVCDQSNVIVVHPTPAARRAGARPVWFGLVLDNGVTDDIAAWISAGGPGLAPVGNRLALSVIVSPPGLGT
jgi:(2Fe-2S) ferredoxin